MSPSNPTVASVDPCAIPPSNESPAAHLSPGENFGAGRSALAAACLAVGLVSAWTPECQAAPQTRIDYQTNLTGLSSLTYMHVMFGVAGVGSGGPGSSPLELRGGSLPGFGSGFFTSEIDTASFGDSFAMIGVSLGSANPGGTSGQRLLVSWDHLTYIGDIRFEQTFPGFTEAGLIDELINGGPGPSLFLSTFFPVLRVANGEASSCFTFESPDPLGTTRFSVSSIPAPGLFGLLPVGFVALRRRRR